MANPLLGPLQNNGGPTETLALASTSPAIDSGDNPLNLTSDQRGFGPRNVGSTADMGAFEFGATLPVAAPTADDDGLFTGTEDMDLAIPIATLLGNDVANAGSLDTASLTVMNGTNGTTAMVAPNVVYTPDADTNGMDTFTYTISNTLGGGPSMATVSDIAAVNDPPSFAKGADVEVNQGMVAYDMAWATNILPGPANEIAQNVSFMVTNNSNMSLFSAQPAVNGVTGNLTFTPVAGMSGTAAITLVAKDDAGGMDTSASETLNITVNGPPDAMDDMYNVVVDTILDATTAGNRLLDNDDPTDGPTLMVTMAPADPPIGMFGTAPQADGGFTFNANGLSVGNVATFMYTVEDGAAVPLQDTAMAPTNPGGNPMFVTAEDTQLSPAAGALLANFNDPDNGPNTPLVTVMETNATGLGGTVDIATDGSFTYTPLLNTTGSDTFPFTVSDGVAMVAGTAEVMITPVNDPPVAVDDGSLGTPMDVVEDTATSFNLATNDTDIEDGSPPGGPLSGGALSMAGGTIALNTPGTGQITYTPPLNFNGPDSYTYQVDDSGGATSANTATAFFNVTPINDPPTGNPDTYVVRVGGTLDVGAPGPLGNDIDIELVALSLVSATPLIMGTNPQIGGFDTLPQMDGSFQYTAPPTTGTVTFTYRPDDGMALGAITTVTITVTDPPSPAPSVTQDLTVTKIVLGGGPLTVADFPLWIDGVATTSGDVVPVTAGAHTVTETGDPDYTAVFSGACDSNGNVTVAAGGTAECIITNTFVPPDDLPPPSPDLIFTDGFESGDTTMWSSTFGQGTNTGTYQGGGGTNTSGLRTAQGAGVPIADAVATMVGEFEAIYTYDAATKAFAVYRPDPALAFLNTLTALTPGQAFFIEVTSPDGVVWEQAVSLTAARSVALFSGFNFVGWSGPELTPLAEAIASLGTAVRSAFLWDPEAQEYLIYFRDAPAGLNTLDFFLPYSRAVWIFMDAATTWNQPARDG